MTFAEYEMENFGYKVISTFFEDFAIADKFGLDAVRDTYNRAFKEWKTNYKYLTELCMVVNTRCWMKFEEDPELSQLYAELYYKTHDYACTHLKGEEFQYYFNIID